MEYRLIAGKMNNGTTNFWDRSDMFVNVGDYAVVENRDSFILVKVEALLSIETDDENFVMGFTNGHKLKKVVKCVYGIGEENE